MAEVQNIPGTNIPTVRELVKTKQSTRVKPYSNRKVQRAEDQLLKWAPADSSHKGTIDAINGSHPLQLNDSICEQDDDDDDRIKETLTQWYKENDDFFLKELPQGDEPNPNEEQIDDDSFLSTPTYPITTVTPFAQPFPEEVYVDNILMREMGRKPVVDDDNRQGYHQKVQETNNQNTNRNAQNMYNLYYEQPVPLNYLDPLNGVDEVQQQQQTSYGFHNMQERTSYSGVEWFTACVRFLTCNK